MVSGIGELQTKCEHGWEGDVSFLRDTGQRMFKGLIGKVGGAKDFWTAAVRAQLGAAGEQ